MIDTFGPWLPAVIGLLAWPLSLVAIVVLVVTLVPAEHQPKVLAGITELVRATRARSTGETAGRLGRARPAPRRRRGAHRGT